MAHPKGLLIERAQRLGLERPDFDTAKTGPEHEPVFLTDVVLEGAVIGTGQGRSKRDAEKAAAEEALAELTARESGAQTSAKRGAKKGAKSSGAQASTASKAGAKAATKASGATANAPATDTANYDNEDDYEDDEPFTGPWPMFDDLLASVVDVAERRVSADLRGAAALNAIRDFSLTLYKELLADLGEVVDEDEDDEEEDV